MMGISTTAIHTGSADFKTVGASLPTADRLVWKPGGCMTFVRKPAGEELIDLLDRVLDKGITVDASTRLRLGLANLINHKKHVVVASIETHLHHGEARAVARFAKRRAVASEEQPDNPQRRPARRGD
jgi:hypothetical protein